MTPSEFQAFHDILLHFQTQHFQRSEADFFLSGQALRNGFKTIPSAAINWSSGLRSSRFKLVEFGLHIIKFVAYSPHILVIFRDCYICSSKDPSFQKE